MTRSFNLVLISTALLALNGCIIPPWHDGRAPIRHDPDQAVVVGDSLSVSGTINWLTAFTDYGIKVYSAVDDTGRKLETRSFQVFWMKDMCFEVELSAPLPEAKFVDVDLAFTTRSGLQRIQKRLPIERGELNYQVQLERWDPQ